MIAVVVHDVVGSNESWYISTCFLWQIWIDVPVVGVAFCTMDGLVDIGWTAVVSCNHEAPIVEYLVQVAQIVSGCIGCFYRVAAFIDE